MSDKLTIRTNNVPRDVLYPWELTQAERKNFLDDEDDPSDPSLLDGRTFVRYKGEVYDLSDFMTWDSGVTPQMETAGFRKWDGYQGDSYFSGVLVRYVQNFERVIMGTYYS